MATSIPTLVPKSEAKYSAKKTVAIIQARMASTRLPGKVMRCVDGYEKPLIALLLKRLAQSAYIDEIVLATSSNAENDALCHYVSAQGFEVFRGDEDDVLQRMSQAAQQYNADDVVRITGDSPLIDSEICDLLIQSHQKNKADYSYLSERFCEGVDCEVISISTLLRSEKQAKKASEREHVTLYAYNNPEQFSCFELNNNTDDSHFRFTLDNDEDAQVIEHIIKHFSSTIEQVKTLAIKQYLTNHPQVFALNKNIIRNEGLQKSLAAENNHED
ncbi:glycosyltransferase family protein [Colwellia sp. D2M02]|uniref:cytidylyltransferase domain-containing protein n=1 Tax=Colwellia sp. D2M02 TaxID=2841562 RepID=UPI001C08C400|nr:glycosyltransferase family protein [Colwellia sp. D2M02]MBU2892939.1 glycosyltransferase family protein [Colwellia sp. D2M02]